METAGIGPDFAEPAVGAGADVVLTFTASRLGMQLMAAETSNGAGLVVAPWPRAPGDPPGAVEASGRVAVGDAVIAIGSTPIVAGTTPEEAAATIVAAPRPLQLTFRSRRDPTS